MKEITDQEKREFKSIANAFSKKHKKYTDIELFTYVELHTSVNSVRFIHWYRTCQMKSVEDIQDRLEYLTAQSELRQPTAKARENLPLTLLQCNLEAKIAVLKWVLNLPDPQKEG